MSIGLIVLTILFAGMIIWVIYPFFTDNLNGQSNLSANWSLLHVKQKLLEEFRDLEFDHQLNKMSPEDYQEQRKIVLQELQIVYDKLDSLKILDEQTKLST